MVPDICLKVPYPILGGLKLNGKLARCFTEPKSWRGAMRLRPGKVGLLIYANLPKDLIAGPEFSPQFYY
jgi:hypothetical protein